MNFSTALLRMQLAGGLLVPVFGIAECVIDCIDLQSLKMGHGTNLSSMWS